jgi:hypothetical protein
MKTTLRALSLGIAFVAILTLTSSESGARMRSSAAPVYKELIIQVPGMNEKSVIEVRKSLEDGGGMVFRGHCDDLDVLLYLVDVNVHADYAFINDALQPLSLTYLLKEGTIADMQTRCGIDATIDPDQQ